MKRSGYDLFLVREHDGGHEFILVDTSKGTIPSLQGDRTYNDVVGFPMKDQRGENAVTYPVVYDDDTIGIGRQKARRTTLEGMPSTIRRRYERWVSTR